MSFRTDTLAVLYAFGVLFPACEPKSKISHNSFNIRHT